tara:strand:- start:1165 stop:1305 length:141 start_codon:yes stop_codon:yes gene_type:complete
LPAIAALADLIASLVAETNEEAEIVALAATTVAESAVIAEEAATNA